MFTNVERSLIMNKGEGETLGIEYSSGTGYGIAIKLNDETEEALIRLLNNLLGENVDPVDWIWEIQGSPKLERMGLVIDHVGNSWSGGESHVIILEDSTAETHDENDAGVWMLGERVEASANLDMFADLLRDEGIAFMGPGMMLHKSVS